MPPTARSLVSCLRLVRARLPRAAWAKVVVVVIGATVLIYLPILLGFDTGIPPVGSFGAMLWPAHLPSLRDYAAKDIVLQVFPWWSFFVNSIRAGHLPFWNPHVMAGMPFSSNGTVMLFDPLSWLALPLGTWHGFAARIVLQSVVAGLGGYFFLRSEGYSRSISLICGLVFEFSGFLTLWMPWSLPVGFTYLGWILGAERRLCTDVRRPTNWLILTLAVGLLFLAGQAEVDLMSGAMAMLWLLLIIPRTATASRWPTVALVLAGWMVGALIGAVETLPFLMYSLHSALVAFRHPSGLHRLTNFAWWFNPHRGNVDPRSRQESVNFIGDATLPFACLGLANWKRTWPAIALAAFTVLCSLQLAPFDLFWRLPLFNQVETPARLFGGAALPLVVLIAEGVDKALSVRTARLRPITVSVVALLGCSPLVLQYLLQLQHVERSLAWEAVAVGYLLAGCGLVLSAMTTSARASFYLLTTLIFVSNLWLMVPPYYGTNAQQTYPSSQAIGWLKSNAPNARAGFMWPVSVPNVNLVYGINDFEAYDPVYSTRYLDFFQKLGWPKAWGPPGYTLQFQLFPSADALMLDASAVKYVVAPQGSLSALGPVPFKLRPVYTSSGVVVYDNTNALPLVYWATDVQHAASSRDALSWLSNPGLLDRRVAVEGLGPTGRQSVGSVSWSFDGPNIIRADLTNAGPGFLVINEADSPGWQWSLDGRPLTLVHANFLYQGAWIPPGVHHLVATYTPPGLSLGWIASAIGILMAFGLSVFYRRRTRPVNGGVDS